MFFTILAVFGRGRFIRFTLVNLTFVMDVKIGVGLGIHHSIPW